MQKQQLSSLLLRGTLRRWDSYKIKLNAFENRASSNSVKIWGEMMVCWSLTNYDQLYGCSGISKGGGNRPGDGQRGFLSKMGMTVFKASHAVWENDRFFVCVWMLQWHVVCMHTQMHCVYTSLTEPPTRTHRFTHMRTRNLHAYMFRIVSVMINGHRVWIAHWMQHTSMRIFKDSDM